MCQMHDNILIAKSLEKRHSRALARNICLHYYCLVCCGCPPLVSSKNCRQTQKADKRNGMRSPSLPMRELVHMRDDIPEPPISPFSPFPSEIVTCSYKSFCVAMICPENRESHPIPPPRANSCSIFCPQRPPPSFPCLLRGVFA